MKLDITDEHYKSKMIVLDALHQVSDPELGVNIVDLGLVYDISINDPEKELTITMTLSTPSCPLGNFIINHVKVAAEGVLEGYKAEVNLVWDPKWNMDFITEQGRVELGW